jgi:hypothetical protein
MGHQDFDNLPENSELKEKYLWLAIAHFPTWFNNTEMRLEPISEKHLFYVFKKDILRPSPMSLPIVHPSHFWNLQSLLLLVTVAVSFGKGQRQGGGKCLPEQSQEKQEKGSSGYNYPQSPVSHLSAQAPGSRSLSVSISGVCFSSWCFETLEMHPGQSRW